MAQVKNLKIQLQSESESTYFATWEFDPTHKITTTTPGFTGGIKVGDYVKVKPGSKWYNGVGIASFVFNQEWQVIELSGVRAVLGRNRSGSNNIVSPIHVNNLIGGSGGSSGSTTTTTVDALDHYEVKWVYDTGDNVWFNGSEAKDVKDKHHTYSGPSNARKIKVTVTPVSKTRKVNGQDTPYWTGTAVSAEYSMEVNPPEVPPAPQVTVDKYELTAEINNVSDPRTDEIQFEVYDNIDHDLYGIPNAIEVIYSDPRNQYYAKVVNDDENSPISTVNRGREICKRIDNPKFPGEPTQAMVTEYAHKMLREQSTLDYTISYTHGYCPVRIGDCVRLNYKRAGLQGVKARVISQNIKCEAGCPVSEKAVFTKKLWEG